MHFFSVTATVIISTAIAARGSPLPLQARAVNFHILTPPTDGTTPTPGTTDAEVCSPDQVSAIQAAIVDAMNMANVAIQVLGVAGVEKSNGFFWLFGGAAAATPDEISRRFGFVNNLGTPDLITSTASFVKSPTDLIFTCVPGSTKFYAQTVNLNRPTKSNTNPTLNLIRFGPNSLAQLGSQRAGTSRKDSLSVPAACRYPPIAFTLVHEVQHADLLLENPPVDHLADQLGPNGKAAYGFTQLQLMDQSLKKLNPQNYAYFGLLAQSNPEFFAPDCFIGGPLGSRRRALSCPAIANGIPGDVDLDDFEDDDDLA
ncbi:hypothetical protein MVEN_01709000 [Mycena venus]|uniref:Lysine-specific metallo-endopeptidase domain-containing protein n=1 Tax=Mycena venus TaxID=2733690 RepID=A0A8H7CQ59_9AGAR|nr:hypothetical protein MVEN_01709000 [Mycena venus]